MGKHGQWAHFSAASKFISRPFHMEHLQAINSENIAILKTVTKLLIFHKCRHLMGASPPDPPSGVLPWTSLWAQPPETILAVSL